MPVLAYDALRDLLVRVTAALGCPPGEAEVVAEALAKANLAGHDSHGLIRIEQYARMVQDGEIVPGAPTTVVREAACTALLDGGWNFGPVVARRAMEVAIQKARDYGTGTVSVRNSNHLGRLGEYTLMAAEAGMICTGTVNNHGRGNLVAPYGGTAGRLATNPISFACPGPDYPILVDITTSVVAEGKVRVMKNSGKRVPEGWIIDNQGRPTTDPNDLYTSPRGAILPFGGPVAHKGFALGVMVDILSGALSGAGCSQSDTCRLGNAMFFSVVDIEKFVSREEFLEQVTTLKRHIQSSPPAPGFQEILMPGMPEFRQEERRRREGILVDEETWRQFVGCAEKLGVDVGSGIAN
jgi:LDH2 family malate/lactate/ureidoglycolate dehydrogenase